jgi:hypothetical protein
MSYGPSFRAPGGHIRGRHLSKTEKTCIYTIRTAIVAQHVSSELRMRLWTSRSRTDRNTPSRVKIDFGKSGYNGFFCYNGFITVFLDFYRFSTFLRTKLEMCGQ